MAPTKQSKTKKQVGTNTMAFPHTTSVPATKKRTSSSKLVKPTAASEDAGHGGSIQRRSSPRKHKQVAETPTDKRKGSN